ncbi:hypothetical protein AB0L40_14295 [Patulibacter sp. NPDC049589]|uniref:hypothetical protein n=1 Tax=Patulibacter sp. NPDC049589 TaxID=3154731 RepID=UPI0034366E8E
MRLEQPVTRPLNLTAQDFFTYGSWILTIAVLVFTFVLWKREKTWYYTAIIAAAMVGAFGEPLYDEMMMLYFYSVDHGGTFVLQSTFTAFDVPQPNWAHSGYALLYGFPAVYIARSIHLGTMTKKKLYIVAGCSLLESIAFEVIGTSSGAYTYWGPHVFRIFEYPLVIGMLEMAQVMVFAVAAAELRKRAREPWQLAAIFLIFPITFVGVNYGGGMAMIVGLHAENTTEFIRYATTLISMGCAVLIVRLAASFLPDSVAAPVPARAATGTGAPAREAVAAD